MSKESEQRAIDQILQAFKFELVYAYMQLVGWTYFDSPQTLTRVKLEETARDLLERVEKKHGRSLRTGGFEASCYTEEEYGLTLTLQFIPLENSAHF